MAIRVKRDFVNGMGCTWFRHYGYPETKNRNSFLLILKCIPYCLM